MLSSVSPASGSAGQTVTVTGSKLYSSNGHITALVGSAAAGVACPSETTCQVTLPTLHTHGKVPLTLTTTGGRSNSLTLNYH